MIDAQWLPFAAASVAIIATLGQDVILVMSNPAGDAGRVKAPA